MYVERENDAAHLRRKLISNANKLKAIKNKLPQYKYMFESPNEILENMETFVKQINVIYAKLKRTAVSLASFTPYTKKDFLVETMAAKEKRSSSFKSKFKGDKEKVSAYHLRKETKHVERDEMLLKKGFAPEGATLSEMIHDALEQNPGKWLSAKEVGNILGVRPIDVSSALVAYVKMGTIRRALMSAEYQHIELKLLPFMMAHNKPMTLDEIYINLTNVQRADVRFELDKLIEYDRVYTRPLRGVDYYVVKVR